MHSFKYKLWVVWSKSNIMFKYFINEVYKSNFLAKPKIVLCTPPEPTEVEILAYKRAIIMAGAKKVQITEESIETIMATTDVDYDIVIGITL